MNDGGKFLTAAILLTCGLGGAWTFRRDSQPASETRAPMNDGLVRRSAASADVAPAADAQGARLTGTIDRFETATVAARSAPRYAGEYELTSAEMPAASYESPIDERAVRYNLVTPAPVAAKRAAPSEFDSAAGRMTEINAGGGALRALHAAYSVGSAPEDAAAELTELRESAAAEPRRHMVRDGDTLGGLAERYYGDARRYREIFAANAERLSAPDVLPIGVELVIPQAAAASAAFEAPAARLVPKVYLRGLGE